LGAQSPWRAPPSAESWNKSRGNHLHTKAYAPLHEKFKEEAGKGSLTSGGLRTAEDDGSEEEKWVGVKAKAFGVVP
jgi:hypothetical protein